MTEQPDSIRRTVLKTLATSGGALSIQPLTTRRVSASRTTQLSLDDVYVNENGVQISIEGVEIKKSLLRNPFPDTAEPVRMAGSQTVFADITVEGKDGSLPSQQRFSFSTDRGEFPHQLTIENRPLYEVTSRYRSLNRPYVQAKDKPPVKNGAGCFVLPANEEFSTAAIRYSTKSEAAEWNLEPALLDTLNATAEFELLSFRFPESVSEGESFQYAVEVRNVGDVAGTYRATIGPSGGSHFVGIELDVQPGQTVEWNGRFHYPSPKPGNDLVVGSEHRPKITYELNTTDGQTERRTANIQGV